jgi:hypothetical protein
MQDEMEMKALVTRVVQSMQNGLREAEGLAVLGASLLASLPCIGDGDGDCNICLARTVLAKAMDESTKRLLKDDPVKLREDLERVIASYSKPEVH